MDMRNKNVARPVGTDGTDHAYRQKIVDRYKAAAKARSYLNGVVAMALMYHPLVLLSVFLPKKIVGMANNVPSESLKSLFNFINSYKFS